MRHYIGLAMLVPAAWLVYAGQSHKNRVLKARAEAAARGEPPPPEPALNSLATFGEIARPIILCFVGYIAIKTTFLYLVLDGGEYLSYFDLGGFLAALAAYGFFISMRTKHRAYEYAAQPAKAEGEPAAGASPRGAASPAAAPIAADAADSPARPRAAA